MAVASLAESTPSATRSSATVMCRSSRADSSYGYLTLNGVDPLIGLPGYVQGQLPAVERKRRLHHRRRNHAHRRYRRERAAAATIHGYASTARPSNRLLVLDTEQHFDHVGGNGYFRELGLDVYGHASIQRTTTSFAPKCPSSTEIPNAVRDSSRDTKVFYHGTHWPTPIIRSPKTPHGSGRLRNRYSPDARHTPATSPYTCRGRSVVLRRRLNQRLYLPNLDAGSADDWRSGSIPSTASRRSPRAPSFPRPWTRSHRRRSAAHDRQRPRDLAAIDRNRPVANSLVASWNNARVLHHQIPSREPGAPPAAGPGGTTSRSPAAPRAAASRPSSATRIMDFGWRCEGRARRGAVRPSPKSL